MKLLSLLILVLCALLIYALFPLSSREFIIGVDEKLLRGKEEFLRKLHRDARSVSPGDTRPPNIVLILADDLGKTDISLYGSPHVHTANMDSIGREGVVFTEAYCTAPICAPSRASLLTGRYQQRFGFELQPHDRYPRNRLERFLYRQLLRGENWIVSDAASFPRRRDIEGQGLPSSEITLAELLHAMGYVTGIIGKWHLGYEEPFIPNNRGFDYQYGFYEAFSLYAPVDDPGIINHRHDHFANRHIWKKGRSGNSAIRRNHEVIEEDEYLTTKIGKEAVRFIRSRDSEPFFLYIPFSAPHTPFQVTAAYYDMFFHVDDTNKRVYYAMIQALDDAVGNILNALEERGLEEHTLVFFASDNGGAIYTGATDNAPLKGGKFSYYEGGVNVPFMLRWKGRIEPGSVYDAPVSLMDIFATSVAAASGQFPGDRIYDGVDLLPFITGENTDQPHETLYWRADFNRAVRREGWKGIMNEKHGTRQLYDLQSDKAERFDRAGTRTDVLDALDTILEQWEKQLPPPLWPPVMEYRLNLDGEDHYFSI
jgi:arylsulfatase A-like enzyme